MPFVPPRPFALTPPLRNQPASAGFLPNASGFILWSASAPPPAGG